MQVPLQLTFRNMDPDAVVEAEVREKAAKLEEFCNRITACHVTVEAPHRHHRQGGVYHVRIHLSLPAHRDVIVNQEPEIDRCHEELQVALRDAFKAARRQLQDATQRLQGTVQVNAARSTAAEG
jgi:ribosome-associated translation inhibitor RaiA